MSEHPNVTTVNAMTAAIVEQDHDTLAKIFTDGFMLHMRGPVPPAGDHAGAGGLLEAIGSLFELTNGQIKLDQQLCLGADGWAVEFEHSTFGRKGKSLESKNAFVYRFDGDRIAEMWMMFDALPEPAEAVFA